MTIKHGTIPPRAIQSPKERRAEICRPRQKRGIAPWLPNEERPHEGCRANHHCSQDNVPRGMDRTSFAGDFADVLFPFFLLVLPLLRMMFVMLLRVIHDLFPCFEARLRERPRKNNRDARCNAGFLALAWFRESRLYFTANGGPRNGGNHSSHFGGPSPHCFGFHVWAKLLRAGYSAAILATRGPPSRCSFLTALLPLLALALLLRFGRGTGKHGEHAGEGDFGKTIHDLSDG